MSQKLLGGVNLAPPQAPPMILAQPLNDVQLVALIAAQLKGDAAARVTLAHEIVAEAVVRQHQLTAAVREKREPTPPSPLSFSGRE